MLNMRLFNTKCCLILRLAESFGKALRLISKSEVYVVVVAFSSMFAKLKIHNVNKMAFDRCGKQGSSRRTLLN